jgi:hypothetical protein
VLKKDGKPLVGVIKNVDGQYRYWASIKAWDDDRRGDAYKPYVEGDFAEPVCDSKEARCVEEYHAQREVLKRDVESKRAWETLGRKLNEWQETIDRRKKQKFDYAVDFTNEIRFVQDVIDDWVNVEEILSK